MSKRAKIMASLRVGTGLSYWRQMHDPPLSAIDVAHALGVSKSTFSLIEQGRLIPSQEMVAELTRILGVPPGAMFVPEVLHLVLVHGEKGDPHKLIN